MPKALKKSCLLAEHALPFKAVVSPQIWNYMIGNRDSGGCNFILVPVLVMVKTWNRGYVINMDALLQVQIWVEVVKSQPLWCHQLSTLYVDQKFLCEDGAKTVLSFLSRMQWRMGGIVAKGCTRLHNNPTLHSSIKMSPDRQTHIVFICYYLLDNSSQMAEVVQ